MLKIDLREIKRLKYTSGEYLGYNFVLPIPIMLLITKVNKEHLYNTFLLKKALVAVIIIRVKGEMETLKAYDSNN